MLVLVLEAYDHRGVENDSLDKDHIFLAVQLFLFTIACEFCFYMHPTNYKSWGREVRNKRETTMISYWLGEERRSKG